MFKQITATLFIGLLLTGCATVSPTISNQFSLNNLPKDSGLLAVKVTCTIGSGSGRYFFDTVTKQQLATHTYAFPAFPKHVMDFNCEDNINAPSATQFHVISLPRGHYVLHKWNATLDLIDSVEPYSSTYIAVNVHPGVLNYAGQISLRGYDDTNKAGFLDKVINDGRYKLVVHTRGMTNGLRSIAKQWPNIPRSRMRLSPAKRLTD